MNYSNDQLEDKISDERDFIQHIAEIRDNAEEKLRLYEAEAKLQRDVISAAEKMIAFSNNEITKMKEQICQNAKKTDMSDTDYWFLPH